jgi:hypothetical protein
MSEEELKLCENFIRDPTRNPLTGARLMKDKGPYNSYIKLCEKCGLLPVTSSDRSVITPNKIDTQAIVETPTETTLPAKTKQTSMCTPSVKICAPSVKICTPSVKICPPGSEQKLSTANITSEINRIFTGIPDTDLMILLNTNSFTDIVAIFNTSTYFRNLLNKRSSWNILQQHFGIFRLNNFQELAILKQELEKAKIRYKEYRKNKIYDFRTGDRVVIRAEPEIMAPQPENYVVVNVKSCNITLQEVNMFGKPVSNNLIAGKLEGNKREGKRWHWYYTGKNENISSECTYAITFGINNDAAFCIKTLDSPYLKYKTLPQDMQHGKPIEQSYYFIFPPDKDESYLRKLKEIPCLIYQSALKVTTYQGFQFVPNFKAQPGMLVELVQECQLLTALTNIYYIERMYEDTLLLKIVPELSPDYEYSNLSDTLKAVNKNDSWYDINTGQNLTLIFGSGIIHRYGCH